MELSCQLEQPVPRFKRDNQHRGLSALDLSVLPAQLRQVLSAKLSSDVPEENQDHFTTPEITQGDEPVIFSAQSKVRRTLAWEEAGQAATPGLTLLALEDGLSGGLYGGGAQAVPGHQLFSLT